MKRLSFRLIALSFLASGLLLSSCNSQPTATEADKTATVIPKEVTAASDSTATAVSADSANAAAGTTTSGK